MVTIPFPVESGIQGLIAWLAAATDGWFFVLFLFTLFFVVYIPMVRVWGQDKSLFATSFGVFLISIPIYYLQGLSDRVEFVIMIIFVLSLVKILVHSG